MKNLKILNIMLGKGVGGLENAVVNAAAALTLAGCDVTSVIANNSAIENSFLPQSNVMKLQSFGSIDFTAPFRIRALLKNKKFDAIIAHGNRAVLLARHLRHLAPLIPICHTTTYHILKQLDSIDGAIVLTDHYRKVLVEAGFPNDRIRLVPNSIQIGSERPSLPDRQRPIIGALGRLVPNKGFDVLLAACASLKREQIPFQTIIHGVDETGGTKEFISLRNRLGLTERDVTFPGWTTNPAEFLRSVDIFCMPSRREVLSIALLEALAAGCPIVCTRVPGLESAFDDGIEGLFVDIESAEQLSDSLKYLLLNKNVRKKMGKAARTRSNSFDIEPVSKLFRDSIISLISRS